MSEDYKDKQKQADEWYFTPEEPEEKKPESNEFSPKQRFWISFIMGAMVCALIILGATFFVNGGKGSVRISRTDYEYYKELDSNMGKYYQILELIDADPIAESTPEEITDDKLKELVASIGDPYAEYYTAEEYKEFEKRYKSGYVGVGIVVGEYEGSITVLGVMEDGPASEAGMKAGDIILKVDGETPEDMNDAVDRITGEVGSKVVVTVSRDGEEIDLTMTRQTIEQESVTATQLEDNPEVGYIEILSFITGTSDDFKAAVKELQDKGCSKFIIDLRDNGGGLTDESINIADYLLSECRIMSEKSKSGEETVYDSDEKSADLEMVVLVNENTASASEILAGALQDNDAATIIGSKTYGKGVTQTVHKFDDGSAIKITITEYFRPNGETVQGVGITPDIEATDDDIMQKATEELNK